MTVSATLPAAHTTPSADEASIGSPAAASGGGSSSGASGSDVDAAILAMVEQLAGQILSTSRTNTANCKDSDGDDDS